MARDLPLQPKAESGARVLDVGCGNDKIPGAVGIDRIAGLAANVVHDIDVTPWPFEADTFDHVRAKDVLEHVGDLIAVMEEIHRVCRPGASVYVRMPFMTGRNLATDPTHRRAATSRTFDYFDPKKELSKYGYSRARFDVEGFHYVRGYNGWLGSMMKLADRAVIPMCERYALNYELYFAYFWPAQDIEFRLRVVK